jgi:uncharacterized repeat protein (TIGR03803 family)
LPLDRIGETNYKPEALNLQCFVREWPGCEITKNFRTPPKATPSKGYILSRVQKGRQGISMKLRFSVLLIALLTAASSFASTFKVVFAFNFHDGSGPNGGLIADSSGNFYGTTQFGGANYNRGVVFELTPEGKETILYSFTGQTDGGIPIGRLISDSSGNLYGITSSGGNATCSCGTVFELKKNGKLKVLHAFLGGKDGSQNQGQAQLGLVMVNGDLYGSASFGGVSGCDGSLGCGVIFKVTLAGKETILHRFTAKADGAFPQDLIADQAGNIYGETGGSYVAGNGGTIFKISAAGKFSTLYTFPEGAKGTSPRWGLSLNSSGVFYGVTQFGGDTTTCALGSAGCGVAFSVNATNKEKVLYTFGVNAAKGDEPSSPVLDVNGNFFGTTFYGGTVNSTCSLGCGVAYELSSAGKYSVLHRFSGANDGSNPNGGLTEDTAGNIYGADTNGGSGGNGVIYKITP